MKLYKCFFLFGLIFLCTSCHKISLTVQKQYVSHETLASYHMKTPDPQLLCPTIGQRLLILWCVPPSYINEGNKLYLTIKVRYVNREKEEQQIEIFKRRGHYFFSILNEEYAEKQGILTYKIELWMNEEKIKEWTHLLWANVIELGNSDSK